MWPEISCRRPRRHPDTKGPASFAAPVRRRRRRGVAGWCFATRSLPSGAEGTYAEDVMKTLEKRVEEFALFVLAATAALLTWAFTRIGA